MARYRKKPVVIDAVQWTGANTDEARAFLGDDYAGHMEDAGNGRLARLGVHTKEGDLTASVNDWLIRGVQGEHYPCKPDIFEATYEAVE